MSDSNIWDKDKLDIKQYVIDFAHIIEQEKFTGKIGAIYITMCSQILPEKLNWSVFVWIFGDVLWNSLILKSNSLLVF